MRCLAELVCVDPHRIHEIWPHVAPLLRKAIARTGLSAFADIEQDILRGNALLWLAVSSERGAAAIDAVASTSLQQTDSGKACIITPEEPVMPATCCHVIPTALPVPSPMAE